MPAESDRQLTCCLTVGLDAMSLWINSFRSDNPSMISRGEFDSVATARILKVLAKHEIRSTFLIPGHTALAYPDLVRQIDAAGHEIAYHGWCHEDPRNFDLDGQRRVIDRGLAALERVVGRRPRGHVAPAWNMSADTIDLIIEYGFEYDGSRMSTDAEAVYLRRGDTWTSDGPYQFGELTDVVGLPVAWALDDVPIFEFVWGEMPGLRPPSVGDAIWRGDFDYAYEECPGGVYNLTVHPQVTGRGHRLRMYEQLVEYFAGHDGVTFGSLGDYVDWWKPRNSVDEWRRAHPFLAGDGSIRESPFDDGQEA